MDPAHGGVTARDVVSTEDLSKPPALHDTVDRIAFHLEIQDGQREAYREEHEDVPEALEAAYCDAGAGLERYSVFERDGHVFGFLEVEDPTAIRAVMTESEAQEDWDAVMDPILVDEDDPWMDEVYRMV
jgi:L-rhamnose mutarotase